MDIEERSEHHREALSRIVGEVHDLDGYPPYFPDRDVELLLAAGDPIAAWVAVDPDTAGRPVVGHVALHRETTPAVLELATAHLGVAANELGVIARLLVDPSLRRRGIARHLLDHATAECRRRGLRPVLDVVETFEAAIALYEANGWRRLGAVEAHMPDGSTISELVFCLDEVSEG